MADDDDEFPPRGDKRPIGDEDFEKSFSGTLDDALDTNTWESVWEVERLLARFSQHITEAETRQGLVRETVRKKILPLLKENPDLKGGGVFKANHKKLRNVFDGQLYPGQVAALNSTVASHESLSLGITQIGIAVISYGGLSGTFSQRLFHKELTIQNHDEVKEVLACLKRLHRGSGQREDMSELARRNIRAYAERAILLEKVDTEWRVGQGNPCSRNILSGLKYPRLLTRSLEMLRKLIQGHKKFVFVAKSVDERAYLTIGNALNPGEYAILHTLEADSLHFIKQWEYSDEVREVALDFVHECCSDVLIGLFRVSEHAPPRLFYAHREFVHVAAHIVMADSLLRPERGFPMLLDVADASCRGIFGSEAFFGLIHDACTRAGAKDFYFSER